MQPSLAFPASGEDAVLGLAADIGGSFIRAARLRVDGTLEAETRVPTPAHDWPAFRDALRDLCKGLPAGAPLSLSIAGVFDPASGIAIVANIPCVDGRRLAADLQAALGRPVLVANDADCFALAEAVHGAGAGQPVVFGAILGTGVGGGLVVHGRIVEGAGGVCGEWGHGPLIRGLSDVPALPCGCGQVGCLDTLGSARGLERLHAHLHHGQRRDSRNIVEAWEKGEEDAARTVALWLGTVAGPLAVIVNATGASIVPVGGGLANSRPLIAALDRAVRARILRRTAEPVVVPASCGPDAGLIGAASRIEGERPQVAVERYDLPR